MTKTYQFHHQQPPRVHGRPTTPTPKPERSYQKEIPEIETKVSLSKDGEWVITKVTITTIKHRNYYETILRNEENQR